MIIRRAILAALLVSSLAACGGSAGSTGSSTSSSEDPAALATLLLDEYAQAVFNRDQQSLGNLLSDAYQLRRSDGSGYDRQGYIDALAADSDYELVDYDITDISAKLDGDILVATFTLNAEILEGGRSVISKPTTSLVTFVRVGDTWKLASDAFFTE